MYIVVWAPLESQLSNGAHYILESPLRRGGGVGQAALILDDTENGNRNKKPHQRENESQKTETRSSKPQKRLRMKRYQSTRLVLRSPAGVRLSRCSIVQFERCQYCFIFFNGHRQAHQWTVVHMMNIYIYIERERVSPAMTEHVLNPM